MRISLNGEMCEVAASSLVEALDELGYGGALVATAVNETFVPRRARAALALSEGDRLDVVAPMRGG